jgi:hypothetical protein
MLYTPVNVTSDGQATLIQGVIGKRIRVVGGALTFSATGNFTLFSDATGVVVAGPFYGIAGSQLTLAPLPEAYADGQQGVFETVNQGDGLTINVVSGAAFLDQTGGGLILGLSAPSQLSVGGYLAYVLVP